MDIVLSGGRVMDPESGLDAVRSVGVADGTIQAVVAEPLSGRSTIDAGGLVVAPGFIDLHSHGQDREDYEVQALDGVTTALELEVGTADVDGWYDRREGQTRINYGASVGHIPARIEVMRGPSDFLPVGDAAHREASEAEIADILRLLESGLQRGGAGCRLWAAVHPGSLPLGGAGGLSHRRAVRRFVSRSHAWHGPSGAAEQHRGLAEMIAASVITGSALHVVHIQSSGMRATPRLLQMIEEARSQGLDVTTECYPYSAAMTGIESAIFSEGWQRKLGIDYDGLEWTETGERLTAESFGRHRETGGMVILHMVPDEAVQAAVSSPLAMIATEAICEMERDIPARPAPTLASSAGSSARPVL